MNVNRLELPPLFIAIKSGDLAKVQELLAAGTDVNMRAKEGDSIFSIAYKTPLYFAAEQNKPDIVAALAAAGANLEQLSGPDKRTALIVAANKDYVEVVNALLSAGANVNTKGGVNKMPAIEYAAWARHTEIVKLLAAAGAEVLSGYTSLLRACENGDVEIVKALISAGADVNAKISHYGYLPLARAAQHTEIIRILIDAGADVNKSSWPLGPLYAAFNAKNVDGVKLLLDAGADFEKYDIINNVCLSGTLEMLNIFLDAFLKYDKLLPAFVQENARKGVYRPEVNALVLDFERRVRERRRKPLVNAWVRRHHAPGNNTRKAQLEEQVGNLLKYKTMNDRLKAITNSTRRRKRSSRKRR